jgi:flagellar basal-body rod modification protein FlgD
MSTTGVNGSTTLSTTGSTLSTQGTTVTNQANNLGENDFLTLMMDQLKAQDPLNPSDPSQYMSELAQFSSLQTEQNIASSTASSASQQSTAAALGLLGHTVSYTDSSGVLQSGTVSKVDFTSSGPSLTIGSTTGITLSAVTGAT